MLDLSPGEINLRTIVQAVRQLIQGRSNASGEVTLAANVATTTVDVASGNSEAQVLLTPKTANAAADAAYVSSITATQFVITHNNNAQTDRTFSFVVLGG